MRKPFAGRRRRTSMSVFWTIPITWTSSARRRRFPLSPKISQPGERQIMIDSIQASSDLAEIDDIARQVRQSRFYHHASSMLMLWGALTFVGYFLTFGMPTLAVYGWVVVFIAGVAGSVLIGALSRKRAGVN